MCIYREGLFILVPIATPVINILLLHIPVAKYIITTAVLFKTDLRLRWEVAAVYLLSVMCLGWSYLELQRLIIVCEEGKNIKS